MAIQTTEDYVTVSEAADILHVGTSTLRRWIREDRIPSYRLGQRRVLLRRRDLERLVAPARSDDAQSVAALTLAERTRGLSVTSELRRLHREMLAERDGQPFPDSRDLINEARAQRPNDRP